MCLRPLDPLQTPPPLSRSTFACYRSLRINQIKRDAEDAAHEELQRQRRKREEAEREARIQRQREEERREQEELVEMQRREADEDRRQQYLELEKKSRAFMKEIQDQKRRHKEDLMRMRLETDRMENEARAALEVMRQEKQRLGLPLGGGTEPSTMLSDMAAAKA